MKKVMMGVSLGLATVSASQAQAWTGDIEDMRTMQANKSGPVVQVASSRVECCRLRPVRAHGHAHQVKRVYNGQTYYCSDVTAQHKTEHHAVKTQHVAPRKAQQHSNHNHQQALQAQRAKRQAMYAAQAKRKAQLLAQQRKRAAMLEQQKRRKVQLAQQQQRAAHQAAMLAAKKKRAALLIQQKRRAMQLAQQRQQQAKKRAMMLAQQKQRTVVQPRVVHRQQLIQRPVVTQHVPQEVVIERRIITTHVQQAQQPAPAPIVRRTPRISASQRIMQQSVDYHDRQHSRRGWHRSSDSRVYTGHEYQQHAVKQHRPVVAVQESVASHDARMRQQRLNQVRAAQLAAQKQRDYQQHQMHKVQKHTMYKHRKPVQMAPVAPFVAPSYMSSQSVAKHHNTSGWQRSAAIHPHKRKGNMYEMYAS